MTRTLLAAAIAVFMAWTPAAQAQSAETYVLDNPHTQIIFAVEHMGMSKSIGKFTDYSGGFTFDRANPEKSTVDVTIQTKSLDLGNEKWDEHMKSADFFNVEKFPTMTFKSTSVAVTGENTADITGDLTLLGVTKPVVLKVVHNKSGERPMVGGYAAGFSATAKLKRSDFGMSYGVPNVADDVDVRIEVEGNRVDAAAAEPAKQ